MQPPKIFATVGVYAAVLAFSPPSAATSAHAVAVGSGVRRGTWAQAAELVGSGTTANDSFGYSVAVSGKTAVIDDGGPANHAGQAYLFHG